MSLKSTFGENSVGFSSRAGAARALGVAAPARSRGERRATSAPLAPPAGACLPNAQRSPRSPPTLGFSRVASFVGENTTQFCSLSQKRGPGNHLPLPPRRWRRGSPRCLWWGGLGRLGGAFGVARLRSSWTSCSSSCSCSLSTSPCGGGRVNIPPRRARCPEGACRPNARLAPSVRASRAAVAAFVSLDRVSVTVSMRPCQCDRA